MPDHPGGRSSRTPGNAAPASLAQRAIGGGESDGRAVGDGLPPTEAPADTEGVPDAITEAGTDPAGDGDGRGQAGRRGTPTPPSPMRRGGSFFWGSLRPV